MHIYIYIGALCLNVIFASILLFTGFHQTATTLGALGPIAIAVVLLIYIVEVDSRKRWPDVPWFGRVVRLFTLTR